VKKKLKVLTLNYDWDYTPSYKKTFVKTFPKSVKVNIPHTNIELPFNNFNEKDYQFVSSYQKVFEIKKVKTKRYTLHFEGIMAYAEVYVNNELVVSHKGGYTPFKAEITNVLKDGENKIFVMVDSTERSDFPPHGHVVDYLTYGGIYREVYIEEHELNYVENAFVDVIADTIEIKMMMDYTSKKSSVFKFNIFKENKLVYTFEREYDLREKINVHSILDFERWTLENPVLYHLDILMDGKISYSSRFAKRSVLFNTKGFFLNKEHIKLRGLNRHQSYPYVGYAMPSNAQRKDADILKYELGCNIVRSSHYPPSKHFLDRCDEIGLLVFNEIPGWQHIGDKDWQEVAKTNVSEMIHRDYNHPSVIIWGVRINESPDNDVLYKATNEIAKELDTYRPTGGVRNMKGSKFFEDVYTYNDFVHRGNNKGLEKAKSVTKKNVPYLVTEYNGHMYPTKKTDDEYHRIYQAKRHLKVQNDSYKYPNIAGAIGWCMFDYNTHKDFGSGDKICYHGVMDMFRIPKYAAAAYRSQGDTEPYLEVLSNLNIGEQEASEIKEVHVMTNADNIFA
jgi:beta-galactosidase